MAWTNLSWVFGEILTSSDLTAMFANFSAIANGDSGAPEIVEAALADNLLYPSEIDNTELSTASWAVPQSTYAYPAANWYMFVATSNSPYICEMRYPPTSGSWYDHNFMSGLIITNGSDFRLGGHTSGGTVTFYARGIRS